MERNKIKTKLRSFTSGFTLLEMLLVVAIIAILAGIVVAAINPGKQLATVRNTERTFNLNEIHKAMQQYYIDHYTYPATMPPPSQRSVIPEHIPLLQVLVLIVPVSLISHLSSPHTSLLYQLIHKVPPYPSSTTSSPQPMPPLTVQVTRLLKTPITKSSLLLLKLNSML